MKFTVTPELSTLLKTVRTQNGISSKDVALAIHRTPSIITKLESGAIKTIEKDQLTELLQFLAGEQDFYEEFFPGLIKTLQAFMEPVRLMDQTWLLQYDLMERPVRVSAELVSEWKARLRAGGINPAELVMFINANYDTKMDEGRPANEVMVVERDGIKYLLIRLDFDRREIYSLLDGTSTETSYMVVHSLFYTLNRMELFGLVPTMVPVNLAPEIIRKTSDDLWRHGVHSLSGFSHLLSSDEFLSVQGARLSPDELYEGSTLSQLQQLFQEAEVYDEAGTRMAMDQFYRSFRWDPGFVLKLMQIDFSELGEMSFFQKSRLLTDIRSLIRSYADLPDYEKKLEHYID